MGSDDDSDVLEVAQRTKMLDEANAELRREIEVRKQAEKALRESEACFHSMITHSPVPSIITDSAGYIEEFNTKCIEAFGWTLDDVRTPDAWWAAAYPDPDYRRGVQEGWGKAIEEAKASNTEIAPQYWRLTCKNGDVREVEFMMMPISEERNIIVLTDLTERLRLEQQAQQQRNQLAHISRLNVIEELAAGIAHEVNQPLTAISAYAQACRRVVSSGKADPEKLVTDLSKIVAQTTRAADIINKVRAFSTKHVSEKSFYDLNAAIDETIALLMNPHQLQGVSVELDLADGLPDIKADRVQVEQLIINLLLNSIEALQENGAVEKRLHVKTTLLNGGDVEIEVRDNGPGIPPELLERVTDPFFTTKEESMGLGLAISQSIVENHGGRLSIVSEPGAGATVTITLPKDDGYDV